MKIEHFLNTLDEIAPLELAAEWDKAGIQVEPASVDTVKRVLITLDVTKAVVEEAISKHVDFIIAYHPLVFDPLPNLSHAYPISSRCIDCIKQGITVYSPHTALDAVSGGMTDWLASAAGTGQTTIIEPHETNPDHGHGRTITFTHPQSILDIANTLKEKLHLAYVRTALAADHDHAPISTAAVCPGAGASMLLGVEADLLITGEMRHHDILSASATGKSVMLLEHAQSERGFLPLYKDRILEEIQNNSIDISISEQDQGPLQLVQ